MGKNDLYGDLRLLETSGLVISEERLNRPAVRPKWEKWIGLRADIPAGIKLTAKQAALVALLRERGDASVSGLPDRLREADFLRTLEQKGVVHLREKELFRGPGPAPEIGRNGNSITPNEAQDRGAR